MIAGFAISRVAHVERVTLKLKDLPPGFEGKTILYVSDIDMTGFSTADGTCRLFGNLARLEPDILILGGDYAAPSFLESSLSTPDPMVVREKRRKLFASLADFPAKLGKFAVAGEKDEGDLKSDLETGGIVLLNDSAARIQYGGGQIVIAGAAGQTGTFGNFSRVSNACSSGDCVIAAVHNPASIAGMLTSEAADTGSWCDVILSGHTHGGQAVLAGRNLLKLSESETRHGTGWSREPGTFVLVSPGLGCDSINFRIGTRSTVHLITLKKADDPLVFPVDD